MWKTRVILIAILNIACVAQTRAETLGLGEKRISLAAGFRNPPKSARLDLGKLWAVGRVKLNDRSLGVVWKPPYRIEITDAAVAGKNRLEIEIANTWANRLADDARLPEEKRLRKTNIAETETKRVAWKDVPLRESGLFDPVRLIPALQTRVDLETIDGADANASTNGSSRVRATVPVIYSSDLFHPHEDPDDHYDLATLFAMEEFDIRGVILDLGETQAKKKGLPPLEQMSRISGRKVPYAVGLNRKLRDRTDKALDVPREFQGGVEMILDVARASVEKITIIITGSCRDVAVAYNRDPELMRNKVKAVYVNAGRGPKDKNQCEWNVYYDRLAYLRLLQSDLPIYWAPCFGVDDYNTFYCASLDEIQKVCSPRLRNYFVYCLSHSDAPYFDFLDSGPHALPRLKNSSGEDYTHRKAFWCLGTMIHAAGRRVYRVGEDRYIALPPAEAAERGLSDKMVAAFEFEPIRIEAGETSHVSLRDDVSTITAPRAVYWGTDKDMVGKHASAPDGIEDVRVRVFGLDMQKEIANIVIVSDGGGRWEQYGDGKYWLVKPVESDEWLDVYYSSYDVFSYSLDAFIHEIEIQYADGTETKVKFSEPFFEGAELRVDFNSENPDKFVFHKQKGHEAYEKAMASCLYDIFKGFSAGEKTY